MTVPQIYIFVVLAAMLTLFIWGRWRYDVVALLALLAVVIGGLIPAEQAFSGFGHPAVITAAAVLVISRAIQNSGLVGWLARGLSTFNRGPMLQTGAVVVLVGILSTFMNNVGALALLMPVVIQIARQSDRSPSDLLMPLSFGSLLGGLVTLIGTPPNIIIATYRGTPFSMFDFTPVGIIIALAGALFIALGGWRLIPSRQAQGGDADGMFEIEGYITEVVVPEESGLSGKSIGELLAPAGEREIIAVARLRGDQRYLKPYMRDLHGSVDWSVIVLLAAMVPVGLAVENSGATALIADGVARLAEVLPPWSIVLVILLIDMVLSDVMNNAATAVLMAPLAFGVAERIGVSPDPLLMVVAIGSSCAFLPPIGHQSNVLVMGPAVYRFGDYWRMGLPPEVIIVAVSVPAILWIWPL